MAFLEALGLGLARGVSGLLSGLGGDDGPNIYEQDQIARRHLAYQWSNQIPLVVEAAKKVGINPLTAIRAGAGSAGAVPFAPVLSTGGANGWGQAVGAGIETGVQAAFDYNPLDEERSRIELDIMKGQLRRINEGAGIDTRIGGTPVASGSRFRAGGGALSGGKTSLAKGGVVEQGERTVTNPFPTDSGLEVNPNWLDATAGEDRYGEIVGGGAFGAANSLADLYHNRRAIMSSFLKHTARTYGGWLPDGHDRQEPLVHKWIKRWLNPDVKYSTGRTF